MPGTSLSCVCYGALLGIKKRCQKLSCLEFRFYASKDVGFQVPCSPKVRVYEDTGPSGDWDRIMLWALSISAPHCYMEQGTEMEMSKRFSILWTLRRINHENALPICNPETLIPNVFLLEIPLLGSQAKKLKLNPNLSDA